MSAARLLQRFPDLIEPLRDGRLCLTTTAELAKVLTEENRAEVLRRGSSASPRGRPEELVAELPPREAPPLRAVVTAMDRSATAAARAVRRSRWRLASARRIELPRRSAVSDAAADTYSESLLTSK